MRSTRAAGLLLVPVLALAGCGGGQESESPTSGNDPIVVGGDDDPSAQESASSQESAGEQDPTEDGSGEHGAGDGQSAGSGDASTEATSTPADADLRQVSFAVDLERALQTSAETTGATEVVYAIELDHSSHYDAWVWTIETLADGTEHEVEIDADTGAVLDHEQDDSDDQEHAVDPTDPMTPEQAMELATAEVDGPVTGWELDWDDGAAVYEVEVLRGGDDVDVTVDAASGSVRVDD